ncbi:MAG: transcription termination factor Rho [Opitutales bacterium]
MSESDTHVAAEADAPGPLEATTQSLKKSQVQRRGRARKQAASDEDEAAPPKKKTARKSAKQREEAPEEDIPTSFSADPDEVPTSYSSDDDDAGDREREQPRDTKSNQERASDTEDEASGRSGGGPTQGGGGPQGSHGRQGGGQHPYKQGKYNKKSKHPQHNKQGGGHHGHPHSQGPGKKNKKKGKGGGGNFQMPSGFAASRDLDQQRPEWGELPQWHVFKDEELREGVAGEISKEGGDPLIFNDIYDLGQPELEAQLKESEVPYEGPPQRRKMIEAILNQAFEAQRPIHARGILDLHEDGFGLLTYQRDNYRPKELSIFVPRVFIEKLGLQRGHELEVLIHTSRDNESTPFALRVLKVMGEDPEAAAHVVPFTERIPFYATERIILESDKLNSADLHSMRVVDLLTPIGLGQRGLIVAPPRTGKTVLLQAIAKSICYNVPKAHLIVLLVDERPEEVTDFRRTIDAGEVVSSTFDESAESHVHAAEMVIEKARRMVEAGSDVIILLDSITRLARAYNTLMPSSGKILSGGVEAGALQKPKRFFGSARNIEDGGSLTILGTALVETGSRMDEVIFEEFKGTGNMELHLERELSNKRVYPALSFEKSGTRKEELLYHPQELNKIYSLRRAMKGVPSVEAMEMLIQRVKKTKTNVEFLVAMNR